MSKIVIQKSNVEMGTNTDTNADTNTDTIADTNTDTNTDTTIIINTTVVKKDNSGLYIYRIFRILVVFVAIYIALLSNPVIFSFSFLFSFLAAVFFPYIYILFILIFHSSNLVKFSKVPENKLY